MFGENTDGLIMLSRHVIIRYEFSGHVDNALEELSNNAESHSNLFERRSQRGSLRPAPKPSGLGMVSCSTTSGSEPGIERGFKRRRTQNHTAWAALRMNRI